MDLVHNHYKIIQGESFSDHRGTILSSNELDMSNIVRQYILIHSNTRVIRAWQGHKLESKWMRSLSGQFVINLVKPLYFDRSSLDDKVEVITLNEGQHRILFIPGGYFTGIKCNSADSMLQIFSNVHFSNSALFDFRLEQDFWKFKDQED